MSDQGFDEGLQFAVDDLIELMDGEADAVVGDAVLGKVVGANLLAAITAADYGAAFLGQRLLLFCFSISWRRARSTPMPFLRS